MTARELYDKAFSEPLSKTNGRSTFATDLFFQSGLLAQIEAAEALAKIAARLESIDSTLDALRMYGLHVETGT